MTCLFKYKDLKCNLVPFKNEVFCQEHLQFLNNNQTKLYCYDYMNMLKEEILFLHKKLDEINSNLELEKKNKQEIIKYYINVTDKLFELISRLKDKILEKKK